MNPDLGRLQPYPFERLARLLAGAAPPAQLAPIPLSIGEPRHAPPQFVLQCLRDNLDRLGSYPATAGLPVLRHACARWLERRFGLRNESVDALAMVLPVNGTREALFAVAQALVDRSAPAPLVAMPNPFYQIYEGAALLAGAEPHFLNTTAATRYLPDLDAVPADAWRRCQLLYICSPGNPTGSVLGLPWLRQALELAERHDFVIASDECYTELYRDDASPPPSLLAAAHSMGNARFRRCLAFHSLSKRSNLPGLRSGFVAGDPALIEKFLLYRTYHGSAMAVPTQLASVAAWNDDAHAAANRALYREKYARVLPLLAPFWQVSEPDGAFYLWPEVGGDDQAFTRDLYAATHVTVVPGTFLARDTEAGNPGRGRVRISLVGSVDECVSAAQRIRAFLESR
jgi:N-succinyldiaminopimelate aminotransferase